MPTSSGLRNPVSPHAHPGQGLEALRPGCGGGIESAMRRRVDAYASKKYGSHWQDRSDAEQIEERILRKFDED